MIERGAKLTQNAPKRRKSERKGDDPPGPPGQPSPCLAIEDLSY